MRHGSNINPPGRFETTHCEADGEHLDGDPTAADALAAQINYIDDDSQSIVTENDSPDVGFRYSLNPYRGCAHGCSYCYARVTHEYLGLSAGRDFETKIFVKRRAPELFRDWLARDRWQPELIAFSGVTDCYQPAERRYRLTRGCLDVAREVRQPVGIVTKNALVTRDIDLLGDLATLGTAHVSLSITSLDEQLAREMEPRTSTPTARLRAIEQFAAAGIPVRVMVAPIVPGLNDSEVPAILQAAAAAGAYSAAYILLRLPLAVQTVFFAWLEENRPQHKSRVESRIRSTRDGQLNDTAFGRRMRGDGPIAAQIEQTFRVFARKHGLDRKMPEIQTEHFRPPTPRSGQRRLF